MRVRILQRQRLSEVLRDWVVASGFVASALWLSQVVAAEPAPQALTAPELMRAAHEGRATWQAFPGFKAKVSAATNEHAVEGQLTVSADGKSQLDLPSREGFEWISRTLDSLIGHRLADSEAVENVEFADEQIHHPLGRLIRSSDGTDKSLWRVRGDVLVEVQRFNEKTHFVISVADVLRTPDGKHLPQDFTVTTWDNASGQLASSRQVHTEWKTVDGVAVPSVWWAAINTPDGKRTVQRLELTEQQLLPVPAKTAAR